MTELHDGVDSTSPGLAADRRRQADAPHASNTLFAAAMPKEEIGALAFLQVIGAVPVRQCPRPAAEVFAGTCRTTRRVMAVE